MNTCIICNKQYNKSRSNGDRGDLCGSCCVTWNRYLLKKKSIEYKGGKCNNCGYNKCDTALTFHHLDPSQKEFGISSVNISRKWETTKKELDKCVLLCLLCHAEEHEKLSNRQKLIDYKLQKEKESATIKHGIRSTYINYKCRCEECKRSQAEAMREYKRKKRHA